MRVFLFVLMLAWWGWEAREAQRAPERDGEVKTLDGGGGGPPPTY